MKAYILNFSLKKERILEIASETVYLLAIFLVPIWFAYLFPIFNMFEFSKLILFRLLFWSLFLITFSRFFLLYRRGERLLVWRFSLWRSFVAPLILIIGLGISIFFSFNWEQSLFGSYERQQGWLSYLFYFSWSVLLYLNLLWPKIGKTVISRQELFSRIKRILKVICASASLVALYGILQIMNIDFLTWPEPPYLTGRTLSTFGQPNFLASFLLLIIPVVIYLAYEAKNFIWRFVYLLLASAQLICLFFTSSRGGLVALMMAVALFILYLVLTSRLSLRIKSALVVGAIMLGLLGVAFLELVTPGRIKASLDLSGGSLAARVFFFQAASEAALDKPLFGYGLENSSEVFIKYYERDWGVFGTVSSNTDRVHNLILDIILTTGFFGLLLFTLWYYHFFRLGWQGIKHEEKEVKNLLIALFLGALAYVFSLLFSFTIVGGEIYFWTFFALLAALTLGSKEAPLLVKNNKIKKSYLRLPYLGLFFVIILSGWQIKQNLSAWMADYYQNEVFATTSQGDLLLGALISEEARLSAINPVIRDYYGYYVGDKLAGYCRLGEFRDLSEEKLIEMKLEKLLASLPDKGYRNLLFKARAAACLDNRPLADYYFDLINNLAPEWPLGYIERGHYLLKYGELSGAEYYYRLADINLPDINNDKLNDEHRLSVSQNKFIIYSSLGNGYFQQGVYKRALDFYTLAFKHRPEDYTILKKIADCYYLKGDLESAQRFVRQGLQANPKDYNWWLALAALEFEDKSIESALSNLEQALKLAPTDKQNQIKELRNNYQNF